MKINKLLKISILTLFPEMFQGPFEYSIVKKAQDKHLVEINIIDLRNSGIGKQKQVDDTPYGGGIGMVMRVDVLSKAIAEVKREKGKVKSYEKTVLLSAAGKTFNQQKANEFSKLDHLVLVCGHYEGVDARVKKYIDEEISIGDFVTTGGEIPAMLLTDSVTRLVPGVLKFGAAINESFSLIGNDGGVYLEYPQYTKPAEFDGMSVPEVLLSGNHKKIDEWRMAQALEVTKKLRSDLLKKL